MFTFTFVENINNYYSSYFDEYSFYKFLITKVFFSGFFNDLRVYIIISLCFIVVIFIILQNIYWALFYIKTLFVFYDFFYEFTKNNY